ncbi:hypothetical protein F5880DRAFT_1143642 [Lentinula raphanica]|nr:hypothetical protein F5880DRAFT_1143642 [Lentinula raphanica]
MHYFNPFSTSIITNPCLFSMICFILLMIANGTAVRATLVDNHRIMPYGSPHDRNEAHRDLKKGLELDGHRPQVDIAYEEEKYVPKPSVHKGRSVFGSQI